MTIVLHDLAVRNDVRLSPYCWRARFALEHKGLDYRTVPTGFTGIPRIAGGSQKTVPVIEDGQRMVADSWAIANYLEDTYPDRPPLFGGGVGRAYALFVQGWMASHVLLPALKTILPDIHAAVLPEDREYFRQSREKRFGTTLEEFTAGPLEGRLAAVRAALEPIRTGLKEQLFLSGAAPLYADYTAAGFFMWWRAVSSARLLEAGDPIAPWLERMLGLYRRIAQESTRIWDGP